MQAKQVPIAADEEPETVFRLCRADPTLDGGAVDVQATLVLFSRPEPQFGATDTDLGWRDRIVALLALFEDLPRFVEALFCHQSTQSGVAVVRMVHETAVEPSVPQISPIEGERQRVPVPPHHGAEDAVAQRKAVLPFQRRSSVDQAMC